MSHKVKLDIGYSIDGYSLKIKNIYETNDFFILISRISRSTSKYENKPLSDWVNIRNGGNDIKPVKHYVFVPDDLLQSKELKDALEKHQVKIIQSKDDVDELRDYKYDQYKLTNTDLLHGVVSNELHANKSIIHNNKLNHVLYAHYVPPLSLFPKSSPKSEHSKHQPLLYDAEDDVFYQARSPSMNTNKK